MEIFYGWQDVMFRYGDMNNSYVTLFFTFRYGGPWAVRSTWSELYEKHLRVSRFNLSFLLSKILHIKIYQIYYMIICEVGAPNICFPKYLGPENLRFLCFSGIFLFLIFGSIFWGGKREKEKRQSFRFHLSAWECESRTLYHPYQRHSKWSLRTNIAKTLHSNMYIHAFWHHYS